MKIKEGKTKSSYYFKKNLNFYRIIFSKKIKTLFFLIILIIFLLIGIFSGLIFSGFFGTFNRPSQKGLDIIHSMGIYGLQTFKFELSEIKHENIKIPFNYIKGQFSNPEKIFIDISFKDFQKIKYKRQQALGSLTFEGWLFKPSMGILITSGKDYVPAKIRYENKEVNIDIRLKGDIIDHLSTDKWSFRIKIKNNDTLFGMKTFSIHHPEARGYINELIYHHALKKNGVLSLRYFFVEIIINGENKGIYAIEEHFEKELIENNDRREGIIIKFNEDLLWEDILNKADNLSNFLDFWDYIGENYLNSFQKSYIETFNTKKTSEDPALSKQFSAARNLLESFRKSSLKTSEVFDTDKLAKHFAINTLMGTDHPSLWSNIRFYYNPITSRLEPIGFDAEIETIFLGIPQEYCYDWGTCSKTGSFIDLVFEDKVFFKKYIQELERMSKKSYLDNLFLELDDEIKRNVNILHKDKPAYHFSTEKFYQNQEQIRNKLGLNPVKINEKENITSNQNLTKTDVNIKTQNVKIDRNPLVSKSFISRNLKLILISFLFALSSLLLIILILLIKLKFIKMKRKKRISYLME